MSSMGPQAMLLLEARVDTLPGGHADSRLKLRPLPIWCPLPRSQQEPKVVVVGWIGGVTLIRSSCAVTVSGVMVTTRTPPAVMSDPTRAFDLRDPSRELNMAYVHGKLRGTRDRMLTRFLSDLRFDSCLDLAAINDARARALSVTGSGSRGRPAFARLAVDGEREDEASIHVRTEALGRARRPYCLIGGSVPSNSWHRIQQELASAVADADRRSGDSLADDIQRWLASGV